MESIEERQYRLIRDRPFTILAAVPLIAIIVAGGAYSIASVLDGESWTKSALVTVAASLPAFVLFLAVRRRETKERFPNAIRKIAWWIMAGAFALLALFGVGVILFGDTEGNRKLAVVTSLMMCGPCFIFFYSLLRKDTD